MGNCLCANEGAAAGCGKSSSHRFTGKTLDRGWGMILTAHLRHVWRTLNDGNGEHRVLALQQWEAAEGWEHESYVKNGGRWEDVEISTREPVEGPSA